MTFCLGMRTHEGLVGIADTLITSGTILTKGKKLTSITHGRGCLFLLTSGLRSIRDKTITYFEEHLGEIEQPYSRMFKVVNALSSSIRKVAVEDKTYLAESGLQFDIHCLVGGQMPGDREHSLYLVYPEGNWVEIGPETPYQIIGVPGYGKPILDRTFSNSDSLAFAVKVGCLAFDSTRISAADVDFPVDLVIYRNNSFQMIEHRYQQDDLLDISTWWDNALREAINNLPSEWMDRVLAKLDLVNGGS
ncbi:MAG: proteasome-type protease [Desulfobulbaceae bacterium]